MKDISLPYFDRFRLPGYGNAFAFRIKGEHVIAIVTTSDGWDHISVSLEDRCPTWDELEAVKKLFARHDETFVQYHVPVDEHVNIHPYCLHLWRPNDGRELIKPPSELVR
jgi:hypothetical protein